MEAAQTAPTKPACKALLNLDKAIKEQNGEIIQLLAESDDRVIMPTTQTKHGTHMSWTEFLSKYQINGQRFIDLLEPLMDIDTGVSFADGKRLTLREFGDDDYLLKLDMLLGDSPKPVIAAWVHLTMFLARNPDRAVPACMKPDCSLAVSPSAEQC